MHAHCCTKTLYTLTLLHEDSARSLLYKDSCTLTLLHEDSLHACPVAQGLFARSQPLLTTVSLSPCPPGMVQMICMSVSLGGRQGGPGWALGSWGVLGGLWDPGDSLGGSEDPGVGLRRSLRCLGVVQHPEGRQGGLSGFWCPQVSWGGPCGSGGSLWVWGSPGCVTPPAVLQPPELTEQPPEQLVVFPSDDVVLKCAATGNPPIQ